MARKTATTDNIPDDAREQLGGLQQASRRTNRHKGEHANYSTIDAGVLLRAVAAVTNHGCAVQFGYTKDGSTFVIRVVGDGEPYNDFVRPSEDFEEYLKALAADFTDS